MKINKSQLALTMRPIALYPEDFTLDNEIEVKLEYSSRKSKVKNYVYTAERVEDMLIITVFYAAEYVYRIFQHPNKDFTQFAKSNLKNNLSEASIGSIRFGAYGKYDDFSGNYIAAPGADEIILSWLKQRNRDYKSSGCYCYYYNIGFGLCEIERYQSWLRKTAVEEKHNKIRKSIHDDMLLIRELPKSVVNWITQGPLKYSRYIFYTYKPNKQKIMQGTCSYCKHEIKLKAPKHLEKGICPHCHSKVAYIADGKFVQSHGITDKGEFAYFQPVRTGGYCVRTFEVMRIYKVDGISGCINSQDYISEYARIFFDDNHNQKKRYNFGNFQDTGSYEWCKGNTYDSISSMHIYPNNLEKIVAKDTRLKYAQLQIIASKCGKLPPDKLFQKAIKYPWLEYLVKLKLFSLAGVVICENNCSWENAINADGKNLKEILKLGKEDIPNLQQLDPGYKELHIYQMIKAKNGFVDKSFLSDIAWWVENELSLSKTKLLEFASIKKARWYLENQCELRFANSQQYKSYYGKENKEYIKKRTIQSICEDWNDYIAECNKLEYDIASNSGVLFPKDLIQAHARTSKLVEARKDELNSKLIASRAKEINSLLAFKSDGLLIRAISSFDELIAEGRELNHCVAGYAQKHADGETTIMVIRRTDEPYKPFYTLECDIKSKTVCQCRGNHNCSMTPEVSKFVSQWEKAKLKNQLKQEPQLTA